MDLENKINVKLPNGVIINLSLLDAMLLVAYLNGRENE